ncbi:tartrate dehydrogenase [Sphaerisporangium sp. NPDC051017]|uniref:tartrate dehydrogenase n=1 Tax=Sphaerisporangium sp. NPDC051017 TaxID=3154636 RepID=UPI00343BC40C
MRGYQIAAIPGDGIGQETLPAAKRVLDVLGGLHGFELSWTDYPWGCAYYAETGAMMPEDGLERLAESDAILLGAVGMPGVPDHVSLWGLLVPIRRQFDQYVSLRPVRPLEGTRRPLRDDSPFDLVVVRENTEGEYSQIGGRMFHGTPNEMAVQEAVFTRRGVERIARYAFQLATERSGRVASATKSNGIFHTMPFWDEVVEQVAAEYPGVELTRYHADALAAHLVLDPGRFDVIVASNLFGDVLSDLTAALAGGIGIAPCGNIDPTRRHPSMFEPIHGSAPDIAGTGAANPIGQVWSAAMMLDHLGEAEAGAHLVAAIERTVRDGLVTADLGGRLSTAEACDALVERLESGA